MLLASACKTRAQLGALSTLVILIMSSVGGSMFPRFLMPKRCKRQTADINAWAIDGFTKVFWRDEPLTHLWPQVAVLLVTAATSVSYCASALAALGNTREAAENIVDLVERGDRRSILREPAALI